MINILLKITVRDLVSLSVIRYKIDIIPNLRLSATQRLDISQAQISSLKYNSSSKQLSALALPDSEHLCPASRTHTLSCRFAILHSYRLSIFHFPFGTALHAVCFHLFTSLFAINNKLSRRQCQEANRHKNSVQG